MTTNAAVQVERLEPATDSERYMAALWIELIGLERVTLADTFLAAGGNSLTLNIILNRIQKERGVNLEPQQFFDDERSTLFELARALETASLRQP
jgi:hypothetical protein